MIGKVLTETMRWVLVLPATLLVTGAFTAFLCFVAVCAGLLAALVAGGTGAGDESDWWMVVVGVLWLPIAPCAGAVFIATGTATAPTCRGTVAMALLALLAFIEGVGVTVAIGRGAGTGTAGGMATAWLLALAVAGLVGAIIGVRWTLSEHGLTGWSGEIEEGSSGSRQP